MSSSEKPKKPSKEYELKQSLLLLATLVATVTYAVGLNLPGGVWQDTQLAHPAGDPILPVEHRRRYLAFYYCNATAFAASLVVCLLLLVLKEESSTTSAVVLQAVMALDLLGLMGAYAAGSCRDRFTTIYSAVLISAVFTYVVLAFSNNILSWCREKCRKEDGNHKNASPNEGEKEQQDGGDELRELLMILATFAVTITYVAGLNPPGGFWGQGELASDPILQTNHPSRYRAFFVCNTTAFVACLIIVILLLDKKLMSKQLSVRFVALYVFIAISVLGLVGAYAAGSCRERDNTVYVIGLAVAILVWIIVQVVITISRFLKKPWTESRCLGNISKYVSCAVNYICRRGTKGDKVKKTVVDLEKLEKTHELVMLLATLAASITYTAGLDPPGGLWQDDRDGHQSGDPVLLTTHPARYKVFFYSNSAAFVTSLVVIMMVQSRFLLKHHTLEAAMILDLFGLIAAYAAGSSRDVSTSVYVVALAGAVLIYVVIHIIFFTLDHKDEAPKDAEEVDNRRDILLLLAILAATLTYQAGLTPPGGFWSADDKAGHRAGFPVLVDNYPVRYKAFFYCNAASFMASVSLIVLLVNPNLYRPGIRSSALYVCMVAGMFGLLGAYAAGSSRRLRTSVYVLTLVAVVFAVVTAMVTLQVVVWIRAGKKRNGSSGQPNGSNASSGSGDTSAPSKPGDHDLVAAVTLQVVIWILSQKQNKNDKDKGSGSSGQPNGSNASSGSGNKHLRKYLMLLGVLAAAVTYQTGLKPPGGLWQENGGGHLAGDSILHDINRSRYLAFFYTNSTSFMASIVVIVLLLPGMLHKNHELPLWPMHTAILLAMLGLLGAYAAGCTRDWQTSWKVILLVIPVLAYIAVYAAASAFSKNKKGASANGNLQRSTGNESSNR